MMPPRVRRTRDTRRDPIRAYLAAGTPLPSATPMHPDEEPAGGGETHTPPVDWSRLTTDELELFGHLHAKLLEATASQQLQLTFGPVEWIKLKPDSDQLYYSRQIRVTAVP